MVELAQSMADLGCQITYVAERPLSKERMDQGWQTPELRKVNLVFAVSEKDIARLVASASGDSVHLCQGVRGNGLVKYAQARIKKRKLRQWIIMETVDDAGWRGIAKRLVYRYHMLSNAKHLQGILAIGRTMPMWLQGRGFPEEKISPFAYFLKDLNQIWSIRAHDDGRQFRFIFVGQFIELKRLDFLLHALNKIDHHEFDLTVIGAGPLEGTLKSLAFSLLPGRVNWVGRLPSDKVQCEMAKADCLVLPSRHDGWGAVISEALMVGTPVICSDACGASEVVMASNVGGVFGSGSLPELAGKLEHVLSQGRVGWADRMELAKWAECLGAKAGAQYLFNVLKYSSGLRERPTPPWIQPSRTPPVTVVAD